MFAKLKKIIAALMSGAILVGSFATLMIGASETERDDEIKKGEFIFAPHTYTDGDLTDIYYYTDAVFSESAVNYNEHLATMSMIMAAASISSQDPDASYEVKSRNLSHLLREWNFTEFDVNEYYTKKPGEQTMGVGMAFKVIGEGEDAYTLLAIVPRSAGYEKEWAGNFTVGKEGVHQGFATGRDIILEFAKQYVAKNAERFTGEVKVWTAGYSRGAGVANLLAAYLDDNSEALGVNVKKENIFAYTFGTPSNVQYADEAEKASLENNYKNIHNRYSAYDIVTYAPFKNWNFTCYGTSTLFDVNNAEKKAEMLKFLEKTNKTIYDIYTEEGSSADPDNFMPLMINLVSGDTGFGIELAPADPAYGIPTNQQEFLDSRIAFLTENLVPDRETYVDGGYEYALQCLTSLYFGLNAEQSALLFSGMSHDVKMLAAVYYCYYVADCYLASEELCMEAVSVLLNALPVIEERAAEIEASGEFSSSEWYQYASAFIKSEEYIQMKSLLEAMAQDPELVSLSMMLIQGTLEGFVSDMTGKVLGSGVNALTIDEAEKTKLYETMTSYEVTAPLTEFFVYLLLGSDEGVVAPFDPGNKNIALAVTFLSNAGRYMRVHNNEIILSWLRTEDSYYENENWHIHDTELVYDADGHWEKCECGYETDKKQHVFSEWSTLPVNDGEKNELVRRCPCGYEEFKEYQETDDSDYVGTVIKPVGPLTVALICVCSTVVIAGAIVMIVTIKKKELGGNE